jgi:hypothetical protein
LNPDSQPSSNSDAARIGDSASSASSSNAAGKSGLLAPLWHTAILLAALLVGSLNGIRNKQAIAAHGKLALYLWSMAWEWLLVGFTWLGVRKRKSFRDLIGGRWCKPEDILLDVVIAAGFWFFAALVLGGTAKLMHLDQGGKLDEMRRTLGFLVPGSRLEVIVWVAVSLTAGFCEEILFRGYLQQQFTAISHSTLIGVLLSAAIFGISHGYEGLPRMLLIGIFGFLFGLLAWWRKSLRPGMIAHAWHDALSGTILRMLK